MDKLELQFVLFPDQIDLVSEIRAQGIDFKENRNKKRKDDSQKYAMSGDDKLVSCIVVKNKRTHGIVQTTQSNQKICGKKEQSAYDLKIDIVIFFVRSDHKDVVNVAELDQQKEILENVAPKVQTNQQSDPQGVEEGIIACVPLYHRHFPVNGSEIFESFTFLRLLPTFLVLSYFGIQHIEQEIEQSQTSDKVEIHKYSSCCFHLYYLRHLLSDQQDQKLYTVKHNRQIKYSCNLYKDIESKLFIDYIAKNSSLLRCYLFTDIPSYRKKPQQRQRHRQTQQNKRLYLFTHILEQNLLGRDYQEASIQRNIESSRHFIVEKKQEVYLHKLYCQFAHLSEHIEEIRANQQKDAKSKRSIDYHLCLVSFKSITADLQVTSSHSQRTIEQKLITLQF